MVKKCETCHLRLAPDTARRYCGTSCKDRAGKLRRRYGLTPTEVYFLYKAQKGRCHICNSKGDVKELGFTKYPRLCIDHDHSTGAVRGLLCSGCNLTIGHAKDSVELLQSAIKYLRKFKRNKHVRRNRKQNTRNRRY